MFDLFRKAERKTITVKILAFPAPHQHWQGMELPTFTGITPEEVANKLDLHNYKTVMMNGQMVDFNTSLENDCEIAFWKPIKYQVNATGNPNNPKPHPDTRPHCGKNIHGI